MRTLIGNLERESNHAASDLFLKYIQQNSSIIIKGHEYTTENDYEHWFAGKNSDVFNFL